MVSIIFLGVLGLLFLLLVILTLVLIFTKKKDSDEDDNEEYDEDSYDDTSEEADEYYEESEDEDYEESDDIDEDYESEEDYDVEETDDNYEEESDVDLSSDDEDIESDDETFEDDDIDDETTDENSDYQADDYDDSEAEEDDISTEADDESELDSILDELSDDKDDTSLEDSKEEEKTQTDAELPATEEEADIEVDKIPSVYADELGDYFDSAFAPLQEDDKLSDEALIASVKEAQAMSENVMQSTAYNNQELIFGVGDELDRYKKKAPKKSTVSSDEDFYWYNKMDVMDRPSYKTAEMYYHYFNLPKDCIDDLLVEMYDCALVRTEEIRYIAYGIKPKAVSLKDIMQEGNFYYTDQPKQKEPLPQDLIRIYEKWCGYVDKLFDKIEIHADEYTIQEIRKILCEYGRNDVDVLLEGR